MPGYPVIPLIFILSTLGAAGFMVSRQPTQAALGLATALSGVPIYFLLVRWRSRS